MKIKCPKCEEIMVKNEEEQTCVCESCDHSLTLDEVEKLFDDGKLIGIMDENDDLNELDNKDDNKGVKEESFNGYTNKETWASTIVTENEYSLLKKIKEAHKKEKLDEKFIKSLVEGAKDNDYSEIFEQIQLEDINWKEISDHFVQVMKESDEIATDVATVLFADTELNEEQKDELVNIFETAVDIKVNEIKTGLLEDQENKVNEAIEEKTSELETKTAEYVDIVVEEWYEDNRIAIEDSLAVEFSKDFLNKLHDLFIESYVHIPEDRFDIVESLAEQVTELEETIEENDKEKETLENTIVEMKKESVVKNITEGMIETEKEKLSDIIESVDFKDEEQFVSEVNKLKEAFISKADTHLNEKDDKKDDKVSGIDADIEAALKL